MPIKNKVLIIIGAIAVLIIGVIYGYYLGINKGKQTIKEQSSELGPTAEESESKEIFTRKGTIKEIKEGKYIIIAGKIDNSIEPEILTILTDNETSLTSYHPNAEKFNLPVKLVDLKAGDVIEATAKENIKGKTEFRAEMIKYVIDNQGGIWPIASLPVLPTTTSPALPPAPAQ